MPNKVIYSDYDIFASIYNKHWGHFAEQAYPAYEKLFLHNAPQNAHVLDLCCGTGHLTRKLVDKGFTVTGIDGSSKMIQHARENVPEASFIVDDARFFSTEEKFNYVLSVGDSLNHIMNLEELTNVFYNVYSILENNGIFAFDVNMENAFIDGWKNPFHIAEPNYICTVNPSYDHIQKIGRMDFILFKYDREDIWRRSDFSFTEACYPKEDIISSLQSAGFKNIQSHGVNRMIFICHKVN